MYVHLNIYFKQKVKIPIHNTPLHLLSRPQWCNSLPHEWISLGDISTLLLKRHLFRVPFQSVKRTPKHTAKPFQQFQLLH